MRVRADSYDERQSGDWVRTHGVWLNEQGKGGGCDKEGT
jgi:hypothetical protein